MYELFQDYLKQNAAIDIHEFQKLIPFLRSNFLKKGEVLVRQGEISQVGFFVENGLLRSFDVAENGKEHLIQFAPENWFISNHASTYFGEPSDFYIQAIEDTQFISMKNDFICQAVEISPTFSRFNEKLLRRHIVQMQRRLKLLLGASAEQRYLEFVKLYPNIVLRVPQWMIASYLGITPESLSRVRKELAKRNFKPLKSN